MSAEEMVLLRPGEGDRWPGEKKSTDSADENAWPFA